MSRVLAYAVERLDGEPFPVSPAHFHHTELSDDRRLFWCIDKQDAINCVEHPFDEYGPVRLVQGWTTISDWSVVA